MAGKLETYRKKRRFEATPEPSGAGRARARVATRMAGTARTAASRRAEPALSYLIQEHHARRLHYDFRLELDGTLKSWAVPKGPCLDPAVKRLAVHVEDHPIEYGTFEGEIPPGNYGAGTVIVWDRGTWEPNGGVAEARKAYESGKLKFTLHGAKLHGGWALVRSRMRGSGDKEQWLLIKERDDEARPEGEYDVIAAEPGSALADGAAKGKAAKGRKRTAKGGADGARRADEAERPTSGVSVNKARKGRLAVPAKAPHAGEEKSSRPDLVATRTTKSLRELAASPSIKGAVKARLPQSLKPQLATLVDEVPAGDDWTYEIKFDGYRALARIDRSEAKPVRIFTRSGLDWTDKFKQQAQALAALDVETAWIDGEAVVLDEHGVPSFQALQNAFDANRPQDIVIFAFDLPYLNGYDLRDVPLVQRRALLRALLEGCGDDTVRFSGDFVLDARDLLNSACEMALEGIVGKRRDSRYTSTRSGSWIKLRCRRRQEFVIGGYSEPSGSRTGFGALLLGVHDTHGKLRYAGRVGTGFDTAMLRSIKKELDARETARSPFAEAASERSRTKVHWVRPDVIAECNFAEWTSEGIVRQASFISLRGDKPAREIVHEAAGKPDGAAERGSGTASGKAKAKAAKATHSDGRKVRASMEADTQLKEGDTVAGVRVSHPARMIDKPIGFAKRDLVRYFERIAPMLLPHVKGRPVALVRAPEGIEGELFFQKHSNRLSIPFVTSHEGLDPGHPPLITLDSVQALVGAAQMGTVELHTWNAVAANIEKPDRIVFDLDPDPKLGWDRMIEAARLTRDLLTELGLQSWCKTSGGKGLHVVVPLARHAGWDEVKAFAHAAAQHMAETLPDRFSAKMGAQNRRGRIFVDYLRNNRGSSTVAAFSPRARPGMGVSVPIAWDELADTTGGAQWTVENVHKRLERLRADPWADYAGTKQRITREMRERLGMKGI
ncbi:DNA ligase D [Trinickia dinghuensis]|uniref:DNA ligase (ATP) n=1 Tax=Trinickia dinghuensis TaxID=2291023 RepID=A0A3D8JWV6_9BURK|nr:DNA ligase D [Trinickia dinghuensis]RDU97577.1 DNA ligase D [Trinickia dinghuensis]